MFPPQPLQKAATDKCWAHELPMMGNGGFRKWIRCPNALKNVCSTLRTSIFIGILGLIQFQFQKRFGIISPQIPAVEEVQLPNKLFAFPDKIKVERILKN